MQIRSINLTNFHGFENRYIEFHENFSVLVGENGTGKTGILEGLAVALGAFLTGLDGVPSIYIKRNQVYTDPVPIDLGGILHHKEKYPVLVEANGIVNNQEITWTRGINKEGGSTTSKDAHQMLNYAKELQNRLKNDQTVTLPYIGYYGTGRLWVQRIQRNRSSKTPKKTMVNNRLEGYTNCLSPETNEKIFLNWIEKMTYIKLQKMREPNVLKAVRRAVELSSQEWSEIDYDINSGELILSNNQGQTKPFRLLSDGYRAVIGLVADIAYRMSRLNPHLEEGVVEETPGIVLIDELDMHIHPKWQKRIVGDLKRTFPKIQFIATTHSPFIIQSLNHGELRRLHQQDDDEYVSSEEFVGKSIEDISESVMEMESVQRSLKQIEMQKTAEKYYTLLEEGMEADDKALIEIKNKLDKLEYLFNEDIAYTSFLKMERLSKGLGDKK
ncbi:AAA family ATPase [Bacillus velezensis]|uniref:AAA family ATPase n=1 Tax=Bacillus velezensis TaxID=492670 RepID=UPI0016235F02|nr:AAA family ATPase [Bacillus velezensis]MBC2596642.1 AAA family ATPase [Bacillus velezensis]